MSELPFCYSLAAYDREGNLWLFVFSFDSEIQAKAFTAKIDAGMHGQSLGLLIYSTSPDHEVEVAVHDKLAEWVIGLANEVAPCPAMAPVETPVRKMEAL